KESLYKGETVRIYGGLRKLKIERVNFLCADVASKQRLICGPKSAPKRRKLIGGTLDIQTEQSLQMGVSNAEAIRGASYDRIEIGICAVLRPGKIPKIRRVAGQLTPFFRLHVVEHQFLTALRNGNDVATVR